jgi:hypothetical protein
MDEIDKVDAKLLGDKIKKARKLRRLMVRGLLKSLMQHKRAGLLFLRPPC